MKQLPDNLFARLREKAQISPQEVSRRTGFSVRTVYRWEKGELPPRAAVLELLKIFATSANGSHGGSAEFTFIDLFAGIGGMRMGFESAGGRCLFTSEWDASCRKTYQANFSCDHPFAGDITQIRDRRILDEIPAHDVLVAGFPCQPFSIAGVSKKNSLGRPHGFQCDIQGTLFFNVAEIIFWRRPAAFLLENVKNLVNHDGGRTFDIICRTLREDLGYKIDWRVIDARALVPQHRERTYIAGFREDTGFSFSDLDLPSRDEGPRLESILHPEDGSEDPEPPYTVGLGATVSPKYTLSPRLWSYLKGYAEKHRAKGNGFGYGLFGKEDVARTLSARYYKDGSEILIRQPRRRPRRLTPRECARLMGFDRPEGKPFVIPVADTPAYKQFGNSVAVPVVEAIAHHMTSHVLALGLVQLQLPLQTNVYRPPLLKAAAGA
jgi:DNA (cytosine-5)-methyltransferase 1